MRKQKNYPLYEVEPFRDFQEMLEKAAAAAGDKPAFQYKWQKQVRSVTYTRFKQDVDILGTALCVLGLQDRHIAMVGENSYRWVNVYLSVLCCTGVYVPIDKELPLDEILHVLNHSDSEVLFCSRTYADRLIGHAAELPLVKHFIVFDPDEPLDPEQNPAPAVPSSIPGTGAAVHSMAELFQTGRLALEQGEKAFFLCKNEEEDPKLLVYTSGTTGLAKGVMLSQMNLVSGVYYGLQVSTVYDVCLSVLPYHHTYEAVCGLLVSLHMHAAICINENLRAVSENLKRYRPTYILLVPLFVESMYKKVWKEAERTHKAGMLRFLLHLSDGLRRLGIDLRKTFFRSVREAFGGRLIKIVCGGAPIRPELGAFFESIGITLINGYGITECSPLVAANRDYYNDCSTVGITLPCLACRIDDPGDDGVGEICVKGKVVMLGYYKNKEATDAVLRDGWFATGDYGKINQEGQLSITGRKKNLIVLNNGKNIYPEEIENYILSLPLIDEVVVYALRDESGQESGLCAEVFANEEKLEELHVADKQSVIAQEIKKLCDKLPSFKRIGKVVVRDTEFEKTTSRKIKRGTISSR